MTAQEELDFFWDWILDNYGPGVPLSPEDSQKVIKLEEAVKREKGV